MSTFEIVLVVFGAVLALAALAVVFRMIVGPTILDRALASDSLVTLVVMGMALYAAQARADWAGPAMLGLTGLAFIGTVTFARFVAREDPRQGTLRAHEDEPETDTAPHEAIHLDQVPTGRGDRAGVIPAAVPRGADRSGAGPVVAEPSGAAPAPAEPSSGDLSGVDPSSGAGPSGGDPSTAESLGAGPRAADRSAAELSADASSADDSSAAGPSVAGDGSFGAEAGGNRGFETERFEAERPGARGFGDEGRSRWPDEPDEPDQPDEPTEETR